MEYKLDKFFFFEVVATQSARLLSRITVGIREAEN